MARRSSDLHTKLAWTRERAQHGPSPQPLAGQLQGDDDDGRQHLAASNPAQPRHQRPRSAAQPASQGGDHHVAAKSRCLSARPASRQRASSSPREHRISSSTSSSSTTTTTTTSTQQAELVAPRAWAGTRTLWKEADDMSVDELSMTYSQARAAAARHTHQSASSPDSSTMQRDSTYHPGGRPTTAPGLTATEELEKQKVFKELFGEKDWLLPAEVDVAEMRRWVKGRENALLSHQAQKGERFQPGCTTMSPVLVSRVQMLSMEADLVRYQRERIHHVIEDMKAASKPKTPLHDLEFANMPRFVPGQPFPYTAPRTRAAPPSQPTAESVQSQPPKSVSALLDSLLKEAIADDDADDLSKLSRLKRDDVHAFGLNPPDSNADAGTPAAAQTIHTHERVTFKSLQATNPELARATSIQVPRTPATPAAKQQSFSRPSTPSPAARTPFASHQPASSLGSHALPAHTHSQDSAAAAAAEAEPALTAALHLNGASEGAAPEEQHGPGSGPAAAMKRQAHLALDLSHVQHPTSRLSNPGYSDASTDSAHVRTTASHGASDAASAETPESDHQKAADHHPAANAAPSTTQHHTTPSSTAVQPSQTHSTSHHGPSMHLGSTASRPASGLSASGSSARWSNSSGTSNGGHAACTTPQRANRRLESFQGGTRGVSGASMAQHSPAFVDGGQGARSSKEVLQLDDFGLGPLKLKQVTDIIVANSWLRAVHLAGNLLTDRCIQDILFALSHSSAPQISRLDISNNPQLTWRCCESLALMLGLQPPDGVLRGVRCRARLKVLRLQGCQVCDRGVQQLMEAVKVNNTLQYLDLQRCKLTDQAGDSIGAALLENYSLQHLQLAWNGLGRGSARALAGALRLNIGLQSLDLSHNGLADADGCVLLDALVEHEAWMVVDLSHNNLGVGSCLVVASLLRTSSAEACKMLQQGLDQSAPKTPGGHSATCQHLCKGKCIVLDHNPLGFNGLRWLMRAANELENLLHAEARVAPAILQRPDLPCPIFISMAGCNFMRIERSLGGFAAATSRGVASLYQAFANHSASGADPRAAAQKPAKKKASGGPKKKKGAQKAHVLDSPRGLQAPVVKADAKAFDPDYPAGQYAVDIAKPSGRLLAEELLRWAAALKASHPEGKDVLEMDGMELEGRPCTPAKLQDAVWSARPSGVMTCTVAAPAVLAVASPVEVGQAVLEWVLDLLASPAQSEVWKLSVVEVLLAEHYLVPHQALQVLDMFDLNMGLDERINATCLMYPRLLQPLAIWTHLMPAMAPPLQAIMSSRLADAPVFDADNLTGRYTLNLSKPLERLVAQRLQMASLLEAPWRDSKFYVNWHVARLDDRLLPAEACMELDRYLIPQAGILQICYVSFRVAQGMEDAASPQELMGLYKKLRSVGREYNKLVMKLQEMYLPGGRTKEEVQLHREATMFLAKLAQGKSGQWDIGGLPSTQQSTISMGGYLSPRKAAEARGGFWWQSSGLKAVELLQAHGHEVYSPAGEAAAGRLSPKRAKSSKSTKLSSSKSNKKSPKKVNAGPPTDQELAEQHLVKLLTAPDVAEAARLVSTGALDAILAAAMEQLVQLPNGPHGAAALMEALPPLAAGKFLFRQYDPSQLLLPQEARAAILPLLRSETAANLHTAQKRLNAAAFSRSRATRLTICTFASTCHVTCAQLQQLLDIVPPPDRMATFLALWGRVLDRAQLFGVFRRLDVEEQLALMTHLGHANILSVFGIPNGLHFRLDLTLKEQREVARYLISTAAHTHRPPSKGPGATSGRGTARPSSGRPFAAATAGGASSSSGLPPAAAAVAAAAAGGPPPATLLQGLRVDGKPLSAPEDDNLWNIISSAGYRMMAFDYAKTADQVKEEQLAEARKVQPLLTRWHGLAMTSPRHGKGGDGDSREGRVSGAGGSSGSSIADEDLEAAVAEMAREDQAAKEQMAQSVVASRWAAVAGRGDGGRAAGGWVEAQGAGGRVEARA